MIWFIAAAVLLILVLVVNWLRPLPRMAMIVVGGAFVAAGFLRLAYVEWDYVSTTAKPLDVALPLDHAAMMRPPPFVITRTGAYDLWLQTDRLSGLLPGGCLDPDYYGEKLCPGHRRTLDLGWTVLRGGVRIASGTTMPAVDASSSAPKPAHIAPHGVAPQPDVSAASDQTPEYRYLGAFQANGGDRLALAIDLRAPNLRLAARHPRLIVGLSDAETAPAGYNATLFCVLCVFGGGFILLKTLVPRKSPA